MLLHSPIPGEHPAAMQHNSAHTTTSTNPLLLLLCTTIFCQKYLAQFVGCASHLEFPILVSICASLTMILHSLDLIKIIVPLMSSLAAKALSFCKIYKFYLHLR